MLAALYMHCVIVVFPYLLQNGMTALHIAILNGHRKLAASLIADGFFVDAQDGQGR